MPIFITLLLLFGGYTESLAIGASLREIYNSESKEYSRFYNACSIGADLTQNYILLKRKEAKEVQPKIFFIGDIH